MSKKALITGCGGMDGSHLSDLLLEKGYDVFGLVRRTANDNLQRIRHLLTNDKFHLLYGDITDMSSIINAIVASDPNEFYNLAAQSFVAESWNEPIYTANSTAIGALNCLEAIRKINPKIKYYNASSSEMFGNSPPPQSEKTLFYPRSPYAVAKTFAHYTTINYRESYGMFACSGILFNHESSRRGIEFVTRKITRGVVNIYRGYSDHITLGNLDAKRDWGYAPDYCKAMHMMLQHNKPDDYVVSTGVTRSIREFLDEAFSVINIDDWSKYIKQDKKFMRPAEVNCLCGDSSKIRDILGWRESYSFSQLVSEMILNDLEKIPPYV